MLKFKRIFKLSFLFIVFSFLILYYAHIINIVKGDSMNPTFYSGDIVLVNPFSKNYFNNDFIVFKKNGETFIKRIVANNGYYTVQDNVPENPITNKIYILFSTKDFLKIQSSNDTILKSYSFHKLSNSYWVKGDNRNISMNSEEYGPVFESEIIGKVVSVFRI